MRLAILLALPLLGAAAPPAEMPLTVTLSNFRFAPQSIRMVHGQAYLLTLANRSGNGHAFTAPKFFAAAGMDSATRAKLARGGIEVPGHGTVAVRLVAPPAGRYRLKCGHFMHGAMGMTGDILVE